MTAENTTALGEAPAAFLSRRRRLNRNSLGSQILARFGSAILVLWAAVSLSFISLQLAPGDIVGLLIGEQLRTPEVEAAIRAEWGLDEPLLAQYLSYLTRILHGDFGRSYILQTDVSGLVLSQMLPTLKLTAAALVVAVVFAVASAVITAGKRLPRSIAGGLELILISTPSFWLGILLLFVFSFTLKLFPVSGDRDFSALVLPALSLGLSLGAVIGQVLREGLERALEEPFALTVRSWGVGDLVLRLRHGLRHAALPAVTLTGWLIGNLLSGAVITEAVFGRPGLGRITVDAVLAHDLPVVLAVAVLSAFIYVVLSTLVDVLYLLLDPRLRNDAREAGR
ncbi:ABC transporter permease [Rhizobium leguminosarum]|uniref:Peptide/nickel transport system permease protein n=1 Tax=Rhizobium leguminosarum TaxID=384 RepID=A0A2K9ZCR8_RHILE|nr:ABC transporter permease [Rhizobium leguminosarum]AUW46045.1 Peptide/nickel transport system permease protein [Rhizobium leguminosarum]MBY5919597.1 ABC transporter permease [Rhizobium leguminosarum]TBZ41342.1 ABC transporter permease [Rhizobium leguminosarum bv. viciae]TBZ69454.1 ABC transporter permease [Rhizobium leguminosarum bv. viciae]TCA05836.1 ABC transporter permease [Rhizobium leguminosarum bv. viciae]